MKKREQLEINRIIENVAEDIGSIANLTVSHRLRTCTADVFINGKWAILRSYNTIVAAIDIETNTLYDFLRLVYGYTATSAQHISKFNHDYCNKAISPWGCTTIYTYREV